jgi:hypothetical protein
MHPPCSSLSSWIGMPNCPCVPQGRLSFSDGSLVRLMTVMKTLSSKRLPQWAGGVAQWSNAPLSLTCETLGSIPGCPLPGMPLLFLAEPELAGWLLLILVPKLLRCHFREAFSCPFPLHWEQDTFLFIFRPPNPAQARLPVGTQLMAVLPSPPPTNLGQPCFPRWSALGSLV